MKGKIIQYSTNKKNRKTFLNIQAKTSYKVLEQGCQGLVWIPGFHSNKSDSLT